MPCDTPCLYPNQSFFGLQGQLSLPSLPEGQGSIPSSTESPRGTKPLGSHLRESSPGAKGKRGSR